MSSTPVTEVDAPWREQPWLDPLEDFQVLENAPEVHSARTATRETEQAPDIVEAVTAEARISFTDGTPEIVAVGEAAMVNEARRVAARNALIVLRVQAPALADSLDRRQAKNAEKRCRRAASRERRGARDAAATT